MMMVMALRDTISQKYPLSHSLMKFLRKMGGKTLNFGVNIKIVRILSNVVYPICEEQLME